jgi:3-deoxy-7-phosphoheptulonate synthase
VAQNVIQQIVDGNTSIIGLMLESNLAAGHQKIPADLSQLRYGVSVTDGCIDWESTESLLLDIATRVAPALKARAPQ